MSTQQALEFLQILRSDEALRSSLASRRDEIGLADLVAHGGEHGLVFDVEQLRQAFRADWGLRALMNRRSPPPPSSSGCHPGAPGSPVHG